MSPERFKNYKNENHSGDNGLWTFSEKTCQCWTKSLCHYLHFIHPFPSSLIPSRQRHIMISGAHLCQTTPSSKHDHLALKTTKYFMAVMQSQHKIDGITCSTKIHYYALQSTILQLYNKHATRPVFYNFLSHYTQID